MPLTGARRGVTTRIASPGYMFATGDDTMLPTMAQITTCPLHACPSNTLSLHAPYLIHTRLDRGCSGARWAGSAVYESPCASGTNVECTDSEARHAQNSIQGPHIFLLPP